MSSRTQKIAVIAARLEAYLWVNPHAADSLVGVMGWWLEHGQDLTPEDVEEALRLLQAKGLIEVRIIASGTVIYSKKRPLPS